MSNQYRWFFLAVALLWISTGLAKDRSLADLMLAAEQNPRAAIEAKGFARTADMPIHVFIPEVISAEVMGMENGEALYGVITNFLHPMQDGFVLTYAELRQRFDLSEARQTYADGRVVNAHIGRTVPVAESSASDTLLLVPESSTDQVYAFDPQTGDLVDAAFFPSNSGNLSTPIHILSYSDTILTISDQLADVVQSFDSSGVFLGTLAPAGGVNTAIIDNARGHAYHPVTHNLLVTVAGGANTNTVAEFDSAGNYLGNFVAAGDGGLNSPWSILFRDEDVLVSGGSSNALHRYGYDGTFQSIFASGLSFPEQVSPLSGGRVAVANFTGGAVIIYDSLGAIVNQVTALTGTRGVYELGNGNLLMTNGSGVHEIDPTANPLVRTVVSGVSARFVSLYTPPSGTTPVLDPPMGLSATAGNAEVSLEWQAPLAGGTVLLSYDDDSQEGSISIGSNGTTSSGDLAVRFTPGSYPATVIAYSVLLGTTADPVAHTQLPYTVWAGNGTSGPGAVLVSGNHVANRGGFETVDISAAGISIASDDFFIGFSETADSVAVLGWDTNQPSADRSWVNAPGLGIPWTTSGSIGATFDNNYMIRAIVMEGSGAASRIVELTPGGASRVLNVSEIKALKRSGLLEKSALSSGVAMDVTLDGSATESLPRSGGIVFGPGGSGNHNLIPEALGGYNVYRSDDGGTSFAMVASVDTPSVSYTDGGLSNGTTYYYYVTAVYDDGESVPSDTVSATPFDVDADIATHQTPEFVSAVTNRGNIGTLDDDLNGTRTPGFQWPIGTNQLFEGAIMIGASPDQVSDAARVISGGAQGFMDADFQFTTNVEVVASNSDSTVYVAGYDDSNAGLAPLADDGPNTPMPISVVQTTYSYTDADNSGYLIFKLDITNEGTSQLVDVLAGMYHDWDINNFSNNTGRVDLVELQLPGVNNDDSFLAEFAQLWDGSSSNSPHIGSVPLSQNVFQASRITDNAQEVFPGGAIPLSEANKYSYMLDRRATDPFGDPFGANDKSLVVGVGGSSSGYTIDPGQTITVGFAIVGGNDEADFVANGTAAIQKWISLGLDYYIDTSVGVDDPVAQVPTAFSLEQNYPNPFNPTTTLKYALKENVDVSLKVYNVLGQLVKTLVNGQQAAGWKEANWDGTNDLGAKVSSGIYIYRLEAGDFVQSRKMILMK